MSETVIPKVASFFDPETNTITYMVKDPASTSCAVIDSVMDIDYAAGRIGYKSADAIIDYIRLNRLNVEWLHRDPRPRRSPVGGDLHSTEGRREARHRQAHRHGAMERFWTDADLVSKKLSLSLSAADREELDGSADG